MSDTAPGSQPDDAADGVDAPDRPPIAEPDESAPTSADAASAPALRPRKGGPETTA